MNDNINVTIKCLLLFLILGTWNNVLAQEDWENDGEIEDVEIEIVKDREIVLPKASRNFDKIPPMNFESSRPPLDYFFSNLNLPLPSLNLRVRPLRIKDEPLQKLYGNYVRAGFGNYTTPYIEAYLTNKRSRDYMYGTHVNFLNSRTGPVDAENSGSGMFDAELFGKLFGKVLTVSGEVGINRRSFNYYGYNPNEAINSDTLSHNFNDVFFRTTFENTDKTSKIDYLLGFQFNFISDNYDAQESEVQIDFDGDYELGDRTFINLKSDLDIISQKDINLDVKTRNIFRVQPTLSFDYEGFSIDAGFNAVYENDTLGDSDELHFYPLVKAQYVLPSGFEVHAGIRGDVDKLTYRQLANENPFIGPNSQAFNAYNNFEFFGGISGILTSKIGFGAGISIANYKNMHFFINNPSDLSKFLVTYDEDNTAVVNIHGQLSYNRDDILRLTLRGDYWGYDRENGDPAFHRPNYKISAISTFMLFDKLRFEAEAFAIGGIDALNMASDSGDPLPISLDSFIDLNLTTEYLVSDQVSAFVRLNNMLANEYEMLYRYPTRGFQVMVGASYNF